MNIELTTVLIFCDIGEINEAKCKKLKEVFSDNVKILINKDKDSLLLREESEKFNIILNKQGIGYVIKGNNIEDSNIEENLSTVCSALMVDDKNFAMIECVGNKEYDIDVFEDSKKNFKDVESLSKVKGLKGIGYRFISKTDDYDEEVKKEPKIDSVHQYFYRIQRVFNKRKITVNELITNLNNIFSMKENEFLGK